MKVLDDIYKELKEKDEVIANTYKEGVFDHIERIVRKVNGKETDELPISKPSGSSKNNDAIKQAIKLLVDSL